MTTATRSSTSRFQPFPAMTNGRDERTPQAIGSGYTPTNWQSNIWNNVPVASKREVLNSRGSDEPFSGTPSGSGALAANSEAEWNVPWGPDNNAPSRTNSGSTSPNRTRETATLHHSSPFFENPNPVIGHGRGSFNMNSRPRSYVEEDKEIVFGPNLNHTFSYGQQEKRGLGEPGYPGVVGAPPSRDSSLPPSRQSTEENEHAGSYHYFTGHTPNNSIHGQRPNLPSQSSSFPTPANAKAFTYNRNVEDPDLPAQFRRSVTLEDPVNGLPNGTMLPPPTFPNPTTQPFQLNPGSQSWSGDVNGSRFANGLGAEGYPDVLSRPYSKRSSADRISTSPGALVVSPKSYTPVSDPWAPRPSSRDLRAGLDTERRSPSTQPLMPPQASFYPQYNPNFAQFPPHIYGDPYAGAYFRAMPMPGYAMSMNYLSPPTNLPLQPRKEQDPGKGVRSALLEEFRSSAKSSKRFELKDIYNHVVEFSGDQHGSRFIQQKLETANSDEKEQIFREIEPDAVQLMKDVFGNYVIQKFFEHGSQAQKTALAEKMKRKVVNLSTQMYACRVVQKALEHVLGEQQAELVKELEPDIQRIVKDQNGNHVVQKIIELVPRQYIGFIMDSFRGHVNSLATHTYGCRVIQRMLEFGAEQDKEDIMRELHASAQTLITDQYGNYVMQHVIQNGKPEDRSKMIKLVTNQLVTLSKHKFASNVVEKCIEYGTPQERRAIREQLTSASADGSSPLQLMMKDQYGNYVIQKLLNQLDGPDREYLAEEMRPQIASIRKSMPNRQIQALDRLVAAVEAAAPSKVGSVSVPSAPATPALRAEPTSAAPTPVLTMEPNSPQSSSPPSTNASAVGEAVGDGNGTTSTNLTESKVADACPDVRVQEV